LNGRLTILEPMQLTPLLLHLLIPVALAEPEVAMVGLHVPGASLDEAASANAAFAEALVATGRLEVVTPEAFADRIRGRESLIVRDAALNRGEAALNDGRALFDAADTEGAIPLLERAVERLEEGTRAVGDPRELVSAYLLLGLAHASQGDNASALESWHTVAVLDPTLELDAVRYAPKIVTLFDEARAMAVGASGGSLTVTLSDGASGEVLIDGRSVGPAPASVDGLPAGTHYVTVDTDAGARHLAVAELDEGAPLELVVSSQSASLGRPSDTPVGRAVQTGELYRALGEYGDTPLFVVGGVVTGDSDDRSDDRVALCLYAPRSQTFSKALTAEVGDDALGAMMDLVPSLATYLTEGGAVRSDRVSPQVPGLDISANPLLTQLLLAPEPVSGGGGEVAGGDDERGPRWLLWAGAGVVVAGGATAAVVLLSDDGEGGTEPDSEYPEGSGSVVFGPIPE